MNNVKIFFEGLKINNMLNVNLHKLYNNEKFKNIKKKEADNFFKNFEVYGQDIKDQNISENQINSIKPKSILK